MIAYRSLLVGDPVMYPGSVAANTSFQCPLVSVRHYDFPFSVAGTSSVRSLGRVRCRSVQLRIPVGLYRQEVTFKSPIIPGSPFAFHPLSPSSVELSA